MSLQQLFEQESNALKKIQEELQKTVESKVQYETQIQENEMVKKELELAKPDHAIYKLMGPLLVTQERDEAIHNVTKRLEFMRGMIASIDVKLEGLSRDRLHKQQKLAQLQQQAQKAGGK